LKLKISYSLKFKEIILCIYLLKAYIIGFFFLLYLKLNFHKCVVENEFTYLWDFAPTVFTIQANGICVLKRDPWLVDYFGFYRKSKNIITVGFLK
jgi:hypothetical protein